MLDPFLFALAWTPILLLTTLAVFFHRPALELSVWGVMYSILLVIGFFHSAWKAVLMSALDGMFTMLPLVLVIFAGILLSTLLMETGSLKRIVAWFSGGVRDSFHRNLLISLGVCNFMEGASVIAEPVVAPMLRASGVSPAGSAALSIVGYSGLLSLEMAGILVTILSLVTGIPARELGLASAWLSVPATLAMAACLPIFLPRHPVGARRFALIMACGLFLGMTALAAAAFLGVAVSGMTAGLALMAGLVLVGKRRLPLNRRILVDLAPFVFMIAALLLVNTVPPLKQLTFGRLAVTVRLIPVHAITFRPFFSAYIYLFIAFGIAVWLLKIPRRQLQTVWREGKRKGWRASLAMALFGAMGQVIAYSGYDGAFTAVDPGANIPWVISNGLKLYTGVYYTIFVPFLGWVGTFLTGYGTASLILFGQLQVKAADLLGISATWLAAGLAVGASVGSISSPFKIAIASSMCGAIGREGRILRLTIPLGIGASFLIGLILWVGLH
jgi:lactate permease